MFTIKKTILWVKYFLLNLCFLLLIPVIENIIGAIYFDDIRNGYFETGMFITSILTKGIYILASFISFTIVVNIKQIGVKDK